MRARFGIAPEAFAESVHVVDANGRVSRGAAATLLCAALFGPLAWAPALADLPLVGGCLDRAYAWVARNRPRECLIPRR